MAVSTMNRIRRGLALMGVTLALSGAALAQGSAERTTNPYTGTTETAEQRLARLGTTSDPGANPDPATEWLRFGKWYTIHKYDKKWAVYDVEKGWVRPRGDINIKREIYQEAEDGIFVWEPVIRARTTAEFDEGIAEATTQREKKKVYKKEHLDFVRQLLPDFKTLEAPAVDKTIRFREASVGLPKEGSWRNSLGWGDLNEDGFVDLLVPPSRSAANSAPLVFLGDGKGGWRIWEEASFPVAVNYGSATVADLNGDGHLDAVFGIHLFGVNAVLGNGKGHFEDASKGLPVDFPTRRALVADFNGDKKLDIAALSEGPGRFDPRDVASPRVERAKLRIFLNDGKANWTETSAIEVERMMAGDWMVTANLDGDRFPDLVTSSTYFNSPDTIYLNDGSGKKFKNISRGWIPFYSYYFALAAGKFSNSKRDDVVASYVRFYPTNISKEQVPHPEFDRVVGIERISYGKNGPVRTPIVRWPGNKMIAALGSADLDGDGKLDFAFAKADPREFVFMLGDGKGGFARARAEGFEAPDNINYDLQFADVNGDKRPDMILMFENKPEMPGSIRVFLNETK